MPYKQLSDKTNIKSLLAILCFTLAYSLCCASVATGNKQKIQLLDEYSEANYWNSALTLALDKSIKKYGAYELVDSVGMSSFRAQKMLIENIHPNGVRALPAWPEAIKNNIGYAKYPIQKGIWGYRVCFTSRKNSTGIAAAQSLDELRKYTHGQATGWYDAIALREGGFKVKEIGDQSIHFSTLDSLYKMAALGRIDLFCRSISEVKYEYQQYKNIKNLHLDQSMVIYYPFPMFFYSRSSDITQRITYGLIEAHKDGSLDKLFNVYYQESIDFVELEKRRLFKINNNKFDWVDFDFKQYIYQPQSLKIITEDK